jgi:hypothetical protein
MATMKDLAMAVRLTVDNRCIQMKRKPLDAEGGCVLSIVCHSSLTARDSRKRELVDEEVVQSRNFQHSLSFSTLGM